MISIHWMNASASNSFICWLSLWKIMRHHENWKYSKTVEFHQISECSDVFIEFRWRHYYSSEGNNSRYMQHAYVQFKAVTVTHTYPYQSATFYYELFFLLYFPYKYKILSYDTIRKKRVLFLFCSVHKCFQSVNEIPIYFIVEILAVINWLDDFIEWFCNFGRKVLQA